MTYLTGPINTLTDFQCEYDGLLMGPGTPYGIPPHQLVDMAAVKMMDTARTGGDGSWSGPDFADVLTFSLDVEVWASPQSAFDAAAAALEQVAYPRDEPHGFWYKLPNRAPRGIPAKPTKRHLPVDVTWERGLSVAALEFRAPDPRWQTATRTSTVAAGTAQHGGLVFPMFKHLTGANGVADFGSSGSTSTVALTNVGNTKAWPYVVVTPPAGGLTGFTLTLGSHAVTYGGTVGNGQQVVVDYYTGTAGLQNAGAPSSLVDRTYLLTSRDWWYVAKQSTAVFGFYAVGGSVAVSTADMWR